MKKILIASFLGANLIASTTYAAGLLSNIGDFVTGKNQHYNIAEDELVNANWKKLGDIQEETLYYRVQDTSNRCQDGIWIKYIQKNGEADEFKHYTTDCSGTKAVMRNAKVTIKKNGSIDRKKQDKAIKDPDEANLIRGLLCNPPQQKVAQKTATSGNTPFIGALPSEYISDKSYCRYFRKDTGEEIITQAYDARGNILQDKNDGLTYHYLNINGKVVKLKESIILVDGIETMQFKHAGYTLTLLCTDLSNDTKKPYNFKIKGKGKTENIKVIEVCK